MRLEAGSKKLLAITKSKAKMYEFGVDEAHHISLPQDPRRLSENTNEKLSRPNSFLSNFHGTTINRLITT